MLDNSLPGFLQAFLSQLRGDLHQPSQSTQNNRYRCSLPGLAGFTAFCHLEILIQTAP